MQIQQRHRWDGPQVGAVFFERSFPSGVGSQAGGAADLVLVVPVDLNLEQGVSRGVVGDFFIGQEGYQAVLQGAKAAFDFAFGGRIRGHAVGHSQRGESRLELRVRVEAIRRGGVAEEGQAVGVEAGGQAVFFDRGAHMSEVGPRHVTGRKSAAEDFARVVVEGENERRVGVRRPPGMGGGVVLPELAEGGVPRLRDQRRRGLGPRLGAGTNCGKCWRT